MAEKPKTPRPVPLEPAFEEALRRLEEIAGTMERGDLPLEESLQLFEEGIALTQRLEAQLSAAEMKVETLLRTARGEEVVPFEPAEKKP